MPERSKVSRIKNQRIEYSQEGKQQGPCRDCQDIRAKYTGLKDNFRDEVRQKHSLAHEPDA